MCIEVNHITRQIHSDVKKRRFALLFAAGDLRRYALREKFKWNQFLLKGSVPFDLVKKNRPDFLFI